MLRNLIPYFITLVLLALVGPLIAAANHNADTLFPVIGSVSDQNGSAVVGATVEISQSAQRLSLSTNDKGEFSVSLAPGIYDLVVRAAGFKTLLQKISVTEAENTPIRLVLKVETPAALVNVSDSDVYQIGTISSGTRTYTSLRDIPQSISLTTKQQITDQNLTSIGDAVRYQPGVTAHQGENNRDQVIIRGQSSSADFFIDGVRDDVQYYRDLYDLEHVEILRGPNALAFGRGSGGGVINRVTKEADFTPAVEFNLVGGSFNDARGTFDINMPLNKRFAFRVNGVGEHSDSFRSGVSLKRYGFSPTITIAPDAKTNITLGGELFRDRRTADRGVTSFQGRPADVPINTYYGNADDSDVRANANLASFSIDRQIGKLLIRNRTSFGDYDRFYENYVPGAVNNSKTFVTLTAYNNATKRRNLFSQTDLIYYLQTRGIKHTLLSGFEIGSQRSLNFRNTGFFNNTDTSIQVPFNYPQTSLPVVFRQSATDADNRVNVRLGSVYAQDQIELNRIVQVIVGARIDHFDLKFHNNRIDSNLQRVDNLFSQRFGIVVKPIETVSLYGSYSVSFLPSSGDQFSSLTNITEQVKPEKFTNYEAGAKWDIAPKLQLTTAIYRLDRTNTRAVDPNDPTRIVQTGAQRSNGIEFGMNGSVTRRWSLVGGYAYQDAFILSSTASAAAGKEVAQVPRHSFSLWNKYQIFRRLAAGLGIIQRTDMFAGIDNTVTLPGYIRADAAVYYSFNERWRVQANVENVLNTRYYVNADSNTNISPGSPRSIKISLNARF
jgi:catecholate siderophore receptor